MCTHSARRTKSDRIALFCLLVFKSFSGFTMTHRKDDTNTLRSLIIIYNILKLPALWVNGPIKIENEFSECGAYLTNHHRHYLVLLYNIIRHNQCLH